MKNKLKQIIDFKEGQKIKGFFLCTAKNSRFTKKNDKYIDIDLKRYYWSYFCKNME